MIPVFKLKKLTTPHNLGQKLEKARKKKGFDIKYVESLTKIKAKYILALEEGNWSALPADVYVKGFLRNYTQILGLNYNEILKIYKKEREIKNHLEKAENASLPKPIKSPRIIITPKTIFIALLVIGFLSVSGYIWYQFSTFALPPKLAITYPASDISVKADKIAIEGKTDPGSELTINDLTVKTEDDGSFKILFPLEPGILATIKISSKNKLGKETVAIRKILSELPPVAVTPTPPSQPENPAPTPDKIELTIKIGPNPAWVTIQIDGKEAYKGTMYPGITQNFEAKEKINLTTGNAGSTKVTFNGKDLGPLGKEGEVLKKEFDLSMKGQ